MKFVLKILMLSGALLLLVYIMVDKYSVDLYFSQLGEKDTVDNQEVYVNELREAMLQRRQKVELKFKGRSKEVHEFVGAAIDQAFLIDDPKNSSDFDYLRYCYKGTEITIQGILDSYNITYVFSYNESLEETEKVEKTVERLLKSFNIESLSEYEKVKVIHDYIITNAAYDVEVVSNSAYDNLLLQTSVCQGYAMLFYKMATEAGMDCRIITGTGKGVSHAWNIIKLDDLWYNIDCTWDDPVSNDNRSHLEYNYFLKSNSDFGNHIRDEEFETIEFNKKYKMAELSY